MNGHKRVAHLGPEHTLAHRAKARCRRAGHQLSGGKGVGGVACGECWEQVIRADERTGLLDASNQSGRCVLCDTIAAPARAVLSEEGA